MVSRDEVSWVESSGDYVRLHLRDGAQHLVRLPMAVLEDQWRDHGFARIHRSYLVSLRDIREVRTSQGHTVVGVGNFDLPVSRRHSKELRDRLVRHAWRSTGLVTTESAATRQVVRSQARPTGGAPARRPATTCTSPTPTGGSS